MQEMMLAPPDPAQEAPREKVKQCDGSSLPASANNSEGPKPEAHPVRWLRGHHSLSPAAAKIIAAELGWLEAA